VDIDLTPDQTVLVEASRRFMDDVYPLSRVRDRPYDDAEFAATYRRQAGELGWFSMLVPEESGGGSVSGNGVMDAALVAYQRGALLQPGSFVGSNVTACAVAAAGSDDQQRDVLPALLSGEESASWVASGPTQGVRAEANGDGYVLHGAGEYVEGPDGPTWLLISATAADGMVQLLVRSDTPGITLAPVDGLDITRRFSEIRCDGAAIDASSLLGDAAGTPALVDRQLALACLLTAAETVGAMNHVFELTVQYAKDRIAFGRPIGSFQGVKHQLADCSLMLEMSKAVVTGAARAVGAWDGYGSEAASIAKAFVGDCGVDLAQTCFQVFGGIGFTWEHDQHLYLRRITTNSTLYGGPAWHRERLCQLSGL
jgi:alkylation response protein AidB-like acyl-CoA dehydrogenase